MNADDKHAPPRSNLLSNRPLPTTPGSVIVQKEDPSSFRTLGASGKWWPAWDTAILLDPADLDNAELLSNYRVIFDAGKAQS